MQMATFWSEVTEHGDFARTVSDSIIPTSVKPALSIEVQAENVSTVCRHTRAIEERS
jgi:hypothetical protein